MQNTEIHCGRFPMSTSGFETYKKKTNTGHDVIVNVHKDGADSSLRIQNPRPTVLLMGWFGSSHRQLSKYAIIYQEMGYNTVQTISPMYQVLLLLEFTFSKFMWSVLKVIADDRRLRDGGLVLMPFSNGGALYVPTLMRMIAAAGCASLNSTKPNGKYADIDLDALQKLDLPLDSVDVIRKFRSAFAAIVFDSCPCHISPKVGALAVTLAMGYREGSFVDRIMTMLVSLYAVIHKILTGDVITVWWDDLKRAEYPCPELYMYSAADAILDETALEALVETRRNSIPLGKQNVRTWRLENAPHVCLLRTYPEEYKAQLQSMTEWGLNKHRAAIGLPCWSVDKNSRK